jgi:hypothetical protein
VEGKFSSSKYVSSVQRVKREPPQTWPPSIYSEGLSNQPLLDNAVKNVMTERTGQGDRTRPVTIGQTTVVRVRESRCRDRTCYTD